MDARGDQCAALHDDLAALAVGALTGHDRARVLAHLEACATCTAEVEGLSAAADALTSLLPGATPPDGFAEATMAAIRAERRGPDRSSVRRIVAVAAVVVLLVAGGAVGAVLSSTRHPAPATTTAVESSSLHSTVGARGTVLLVSSSHRDWLVVDVRDAPSSGRVSCTLTLADGTRLWVGAFPLARGHGSWTTWLSVPARSVRAVDMTDQGGTTVASARLR